MKLGCAGSAILDPCLGQFAQRLGTLACVGNAPVRECCPGIEVCSADGMIIQAACFRSMIGRCLRPSWYVTENVSRLQNTALSRCAGHFARGSKRAFSLAGLRSS